MSFNHHYILIMAGGSGTRLYPRSRDVKPKQFQNIIGNKTLLEQTYDRAIQVVSNNHIYISSNHRYTDLIKECLPAIPVQNYITEPVKRNNGPAMALANAIIQARDPQAIIASFHADHLVLKDDQFVHSIKAGFKTIEKYPTKILCIGIRPTKPHTGYGYIERDSLVDGISGYSIYQVKQFIEKPDQKTAEQYLKKGSFLWNAGYFIWNTVHFSREIKKHLPAVAKGLKIITARIGQLNFRPTLDQEFKRFPDIAIDYALMEKTDLLLLPADLGWSDIGSWDAVVDTISSESKDPDGNYSEGLISLVDCHQTTILGHNENKLVAAIGLDNVIVVTTDDVVLITARGRSESVKKIIEDLKNRRKHHLL